MHYLLKTEPTAYSFADLVREKETDWTGVTNPQAVKNLKGMQKGDKLVIYHTGDEKTAVGLAHVKAVDLSDPRVPLIHIAVGPAIKRPKTLAEMKQQSLFAVSPLVRQSRLSVVPLDEAQYDWIVHN
ncbi:MAG TPA: EVE domain-containing protein [Acidobacteriaceae bacterium]|jgi:predicted RNA-binding protein with PUA-like domain|nr:EVE domain-containing protein [Acidobacteriaceae bacterium]